MKTLIAFLMVGILAISGLAFAAHKDKHKKKIPGEPSGNFLVLPIIAGATCTALIEEPEGVDVDVHGGPAKWGFTGEEELVVTPLSEDPDVVQVCFADPFPRVSDVLVRISFKDEVVPE